MGRMEQQQAGDYTRNGEGRGGGTVPRINDLGSRCRCGHVTPVTSLRREATAIGRSGGRCRETVNSLHSGAPAGTKKKLQVGQQWKAVCFLRPHLMCIHGLTIWITSSAQNVVFRSAMAYGGRSDTLPPLPTRHQLGLP